MAVKVIKLNADGTQQEYAGKNASAGAGDAGEFAILDAAGKLSTTMMPNGVGADSITATAGEALAAGDFVYITAAGAVMKADASLPAKAARGYVIAAVLNAGQATVYFDESNTGVAGLTPGVTYFLSDVTPGGVTTAPPTTAGKIVQELGFAVTATSLHVNIQEPITRA